MLVQNGGVGGEQDTQSYGQGKKWGPFIPSGGSTVMDVLKVTESLAWKYPTEALWAWQSKETYPKSSCA